MNHAINSVKKAFNRLKVAPKVRKKSEQSARNKTSTNRNKTINKFAIPESDRLSLVHVDCVHVLE